MDHLRNTSVAFALSLLILGSFCLMNIGSTLIVPTANSLYIDSVHSTLSIPLIGMLSLLYLKFVWKMIHL